MPFMIFYQQSAVVDKGLTPADLPSARAETALGCCLTQLVMCAIIVAAATLADESAGGLSSIGQIAAAFTAQIGETAGTIVFGLGVAGASMVAAVVVACAAAWGLGEVAGYRKSLDDGVIDAPAFYAVFAACVLAGNVVSVLCSARAIVQISVAIEVLNAVLLVPVLGFLYALAVRALPEEHALRGRAAVLYAVVFGTVVLLSVGSCVASFVL